MPDKTHQDEIAKARLKKALASYRDQHGSTNREISRLIGMSESLFSQYVNGNKPLSDKALNRFCQTLGINKSTIRPDLYEKTSTVIPVIGTMTNELPMASCTRIKIRDYKEGLVCVESNLLFSADETRHGYIVIDTDTPPKPGDDVIYRRRDNPNFRQGKLKIFMRDNVTIALNDYQDSTMKMTALAWIGRVHEYVTLEL